ncbi:stage 0 sporulation protein, partial [Listeria monocytogenes]|nr:stage 0 sporulation protein [Listeria monocytogenes]
QVSLPEEETVIEYELDELRPYNEFLKQPAKS